MRESIDGYDWDIQDEPETYSRQRMDDALDRALELKRSQHPAWHEYSGLCSLRFTLPKAGRNGMVPIGYLRTHAWRLKVFWDPKTDRVQVEREPTPLSMALPPPPEGCTPSPPRKPWAFQFIVNFSFVHYGERVSVRVKPFPSAAHPDHTGRDVVLRPTKPAGVPGWKWADAMNMASLRLNVVEFDDEIKTVSGSAIRRMFMETIQAMVK